MPRLFSRKSTKLRVEPVTSAIIVAYIIAWASGVSLGAYVWKEGELRHTYPVSYEAAWGAASDAMESLDIAVLEKKQEGNLGTITARRADETDVIIKIKQLSDESTQVGVRVGMPVTSGRISLGDKAASKRIHEAIQTKL